MIPFKKIGVVGAGSMGQGIAEVCALGGYEVLFYDVDQSAAQKAIQNIANDFNFAIAKGKLSEEKKAVALGRIKAVPFDELKVDLVIEAIVENLEVKQDLFGALENSCSSKTIFTSNTSSLSITKIASVLRHPSRLLGLHFFNPAHLMKLVEVIAGRSTDQHFIHPVVEFAQVIGKIPVVVKDSPGFIVNRVARLYYLESLKALEDGNADIGTIDALMRSAGFKLGPFELMDLIGNDVNLQVSRLLYEAFDRPPRFKPSRIQEKKVEERELGKKTGKGYYSYEKK